jgi:hypothetical protein
LSHLSNVLCSGPFDLLVSIESLIVLDCHKVSIIGGGSDI